MGLDERLYFLPHILHDRNYPLTFLPYILVPPVFSPSSQSIGQGQHTVLPGLNVWF
jgi:hypothetical protein